MVWIRRSNGWGEFNFESKQLVIESHRGLYQPSMLVVHFFYLCISIFTVQFQFMGLLILNIFCFCFSTLYIFVYNGTFINVVLLVEYIQLLLIILALQGWKAGG